MYKYFKLLFLFSIYFILVSCNNIDRDEIDMYLAASLLSQVESSSKNYDDVVNIDSSGSYDLVNKIILGAEPDLVLLANYDLKNSFNYSDLTLITDIYSAGEKPIPGISSLLFEGEGIKYIKSPRLVPHYVKTNIKSGDTVLTIGAGDITLLGPQILKYLNENK